MSCMEVVSGLWLLSMRAEVSSMSVDGLSMIELIAYCSLDQIVILRLIRVTKRINRDVEEF